MSAIGDYLKEREALGGSGIDTGLDAIREANQRQALSRLVEEDRNAILSQSHLEQQAGVEVSSEQESMNPFFQYGLARREKGDDALEYAEAAVRSGEISIPEGAQLRMLSTRTGGYAIGYLDPNESKFFLLEDPRTWSMADVGKVGAGIGTLEMAGAVAGGVAGAKWAAGRAKDTFQYAGNLLRRNLPAVFGATAGRAADEAMEGADATDVALRTGETFVIESLVGVPINEIALPITRAIKGERAFIGSITEEKERALAAAERLKEQELIPEDFNFTSGQLGNTAAERMAYIGERLDEGVASEARKQRSTPAQALSSMNMEELRELSDEDIYAILEQNEIELNASIRAALSERPDVEDLGLNTPEARLFESEAGRVMAERFTDYIDNLRFVRDQQYDRAYELAERYEVVVDVRQVKEVAEEILYEPRGQRDTVPGTSPVQPQGDPYRTGVEGRVPTQNPQSDVRWHPDSDDKLIAAARRLVQYKDYQDPGYYADLRTVRSRIAAQTAHDPYFATSVGKMHAKRLLDALDGALEGGRPTAPRTLADLDEDGVPQAQHVIHEAFERARQLSTRYHLVSDRFPITAAMKLGGGATYKQITQNNTFKDMTIEMVDDLEDILGQSGLRQFRAAYLNDLIENPSKIDNYGGISVEVRDRLLPRDVVQQLKVYQHRLRRAGSEGVARLLSEDIAPRDRLARAMETGTVDQIVSLMTRPEIDSAGWQLIMERSISNLDRNNPVLEQARYAKAIDDLKQRGIWDEMSEGTRAMLSDIEAVNGLIHAVADSGASIAAAAIAAEMADVAAPKKAAQAWLRKNQIAIISRVANNSRVQDILLTGDVPMANKSEVLVRAILNAMTVFARDASLGAMRPGDEQYPMREEEM